MLLLVALKINVTVTTGEALIWFDLILKCAARQFAVLSLGTVEFVLQVEGVAQTREGIGCFVWPCIIDTTIQTAN